MGSCDIDTNASVNMVLKYLCRIIQTERLDVQNPGLNVYRIVQSQKATISKSAELDVESCQFLRMPKFEKKYKEGGGNFSI